MFKIIYKKKQNLNTVYQFYANPRYDAYVLCELTEN